MIRSESIPTAVRPQSSVLEACIGWHFSVKAHRQSIANYKASVLIDELPGIGSKNAVKFDV